MTYYLATDRPALPKPRPGVIKSLRNDALLHVIALATISAAAIGTMLIGLPPDLRMVFLFTAPVVVTIALMAMIRLAREALALRRADYEGNLAAALAHTLRTDILAPARIVNGLHATVFLTVFLTGFSAIKRAIPLVVPFSWDETFMRLDLALHFGRHPYEWLAPLLNVAWISATLNVTYNAWLLVMFGCLIWQGCARADSELRQRFFLAFCLLWILGTCIMGTVFSSVGPCFYGRLLPGEDPYAPLMQWLRTADTEYTIWALKVMDVLWSHYESGKGAINGISAMPSMHVGSSILFALLGFASGNRAVAWALAAFAALIALGSVHLGWHYAVDGYAGAAVAALSWWGGGRLARWDRRLRGEAPDVGQ